MKAWVWLGLAGVCTTVGCKSSSRSHVDTLECSSGQISACLGEDDCRGERVCRDDEPTWGECVCLDESTSGSGGETSASASSGAGAGNENSGGSSGGDAATGGSASTSGNDGGSGGDGATGGSGGDGATGGSGDGATGGGGTGGSGGATVAACPMALPGPRLINIPAGTTDIGQVSSVSGLYDTEPVTRTELAAFCLDETEVTIGDYWECAELVCTVPQIIEPSNPPFPATYYACNFEGPPPADVAELPVNCVSWEQANTYCQWAGKRLPSEFEWEYAARGAAARAYPWGNDDPASDASNPLANWNSDAPVVVGSYPDGASPEGVLDLTGNLWEWVEDVYCDGYDSTTRTCLSTHVARGGAWSTELIDYLRAWARDPDADGDARYGFRCAYTP